MRSGGLSILLAVLMMTICFAAPGQAQESKIVELPEPNMEGGMPLMEALKLRQTMREYSDRQLVPQVLSDLLWAAFGVNRPESGKRTAPSAMNLQEIDIYVALAEGLYLFRPEDHVLEMISGDDIRAMTGGQDFVAGAPVNLVFVADYSRMTRGSAADKDFYSATDTGFISQNVYLFCASEGLATVVRGWVDRDALAKAMGLGEDQKIILAQTVGYPKVEEE